MMRLKRVDAVIKRRRENAEAYMRMLDSERVFVPRSSAHQFNTYHTFVIQVDRRDELQKHLLDKGIGSAVHYPVPIHLQPAASALGYKEGDFPQAEIQAKRILSIPIHQYLSSNDVHFVAETINQFLR